MASRRRAGERITGQYLPIGSQMKCCGTPGGGAEDADFGAESNFGRHKVVELAAPSTHGWTSRSTSLAGQVRT